MTRIKTQKLLNHINNFPLNLLKMYHFCNIQLKRKWMWMLNVFTILSLLYLFRYCTFASAINCLILLMSIQSSVVFQLSYGIYKSQYKQLTRFAQHIHITHTHTLTMNCNICYCVNVEYSTFQRIRLEQCCHYNSSLLFFMHRSQIFTCVWKKN